MSVDLLLLAYHGLAERNARGRDVTPARLRRQLELLLARGYRAATFLEATTRTGGGRTVAVTFDDAERSVVELGLPVLRELAVPATIFVPSETVGLPGVASWEDLRRLVEHGWEIGSHGGTHRALPPLPDDELQQELAGSRARIEASLGCRCVSIAYPYGHADERCVAAARRAGYVTGCVLSEWPGIPDGLARPRVGIGPADGGLRFRVKTSRLGRRARASRLGPVAAALGRTLSRPR